MAWQVPYVSQLLAWLDQYARENRTTFALLCFAVVMLSVWLKRYFSRRGNRHRAAAHKVSSRLTKKLHYLIVSIGTRGDVQPFLALAKGLLARGHSVTVCTCDQFKDFVIGEGLRFASVGIEHVKQTEVWVSAKTMPEFIKGTMGDVLPQNKTVCEHVLLAAKGVSGKPKADVIMVNVFAQQIAMDVAEVVHIPCWSLRLCPEEPSRYYPVFGSEPARWPWLQLLSHYGAALAKVKAATEVGVSKYQNEYRASVLKLPKVGLSRLREMSHMPTLHGYSAHLVPRPRDWGEWLMVSGYWFMDGASPTAPYQPPQHLTDFLAAGAPPVCVTFGSMAALDTTDVVGNAIEGVLAAGQRCVLISAWTSSPQQVPANVCIIDRAPHEWLFPKCAAVVFHGGAGTFARVAQAGVPAVIVPILKFFDQRGWAKAAERCDIGVHIAGEPTVAALTAAVKQVTVGQSHSMVNGLAKVGQVLREEDGVARALEQLECCLCARVKATPDDFTPAVSQMCDRHCIACRYSS